MGTTPAPLEEGLKDFLDKRTIDDNMTILILPFTNINGGADFSAVETIWNYFTCIARELFGANIPEDRIRNAYICTPPGWVSSLKYKPHRREQFPETINPAKTYLIIDDTVESGRTMGYVIQELLYRGAHIKDIYAFASIYTGRFGEQNLRFGPAEDFINYVTRHKIPARQNLSGFSKIFIERPATL